MHAPPTPAPGRRPRAPPPVSEQREGHRGGSETRRGGSGRGAPQPGRGDVQSGGRAEFWGLRDPEGGSEHAVVCPRGRGRLSHCAPRPRAWSCLVAGRDRVQQDTAQAPLSRRPVLSTVTVLGIEAGGDPGLLGHSPQDKSASDQLMPRGLACLPGVPGAGDHEQAMTRPAAARAHVAGDRQ